MKKLSLVIVNDDADEYLPYLLKSIPDDIKEKINIILINNHYKKLNKDQFSFSKEQFTEIYNFPQRITNRGILYNMGLNLAQTEYIIFAHADIYFYPYFFQRLFVKLEDNISNIVNFDILKPDHSLFGQNELYFNNVQIKYKTIYASSSLTPMLKCSEACFMIKKDLETNIKFQVEYQNGFFEYDFLLKLNTNLLNHITYKDCKLVHYFLEEYDKLSSLEFDKKIFLEKNRKQLRKLGYLKTLLNNLYEASERNEFGIYIFGTGHGGEFLLNQLQIKNKGKYIIRGFLDNDLSRQGIMIKGIKVFLPGDVIVNEKEYIFISSHSYDQEMQEQLLSLGIKQEQIIRPKEFCHDFISC